MDIDNLSRVGDEFIEGLPKAELHLHIEGTLEPGMMRALAARNGVPLPFASAAEIRAAYHFGNLQEFLDIYYRGLSVLVGERDFHDLTLAYFDRARRQNIRHAEIFFDPQAHTERGLNFATVFSGIDKARRAAERDWGVSSRLIMCFLRNLEPASALRTLDSALPFRDRIVAVGLDSAEAGNPPGKFRDVFEKARAAGFLAVAHAGEEGPSEYVSSALDDLGVSRIDHGNRALENPDLVARLAAAATPLTVCPLSNLKLGVVPELSVHPLREMMARGLMVTVNSDDPAYFGGYLNENLIAIARALGLGRDDLHRLARNGFEASFLPPARKADLLGEVDAYVRAAIRGRPQGVAHSDQVSSRSFPSVCSKVFP